MPIDARIPLQAQGIQLQNPIEAASKAMTMKQLMLQGQEQERQIADDQALRTAFKNNVVQGEDGAYSLDRKATMADLMKSGQGTKALELQSQWNKQDREGQLHQLDLRVKQGGVAKDLAFSVMPDGSNYQQVRNEMIKLGLPNAQKLPEQFMGQGWLKQWQMNALSGTEQLAQQAKQMQQEWQNQKYEADQEWKRRNYEQRDRQIEATQGARQDQREYKRQEAETKKIESLTVPGLGLAQTPQDAKTLKSAVEMKAKFDRQMEELLTLRGGKVNPKTGEREGGLGVEYFNREAVGRGKQLSKDLLLTYKNLAKLGVLSKADEDIINAIIPSDPLGQDWMPWQDSIMVQLEGFKADLDDDFKTTIKTRLRNPEEALSRIDGQGPPPPLSTEDQQALSWAQANPQDPRAQAIMQMHGGGR